MTLELTITPPPSNPSPALAGKGKAFDLVNDDFFSSFADLLDVINPIQHIPLVGGIYRSLTHDTISTGAQLAGGALFGGPVGLVASVANMIFEQQTGGNVAENLFAAVTGKYELAQNSVRSEAKAQNPLQS